MTSSKTSRDLGYYFDILWKILCRTTFMQSFIAMAKWMSKNPVWLGLMEKAAKWFQEACQILNEKNKMIAWKYKQWRQLLFLQSVILLFIFSCMELFWDLRSMKVRKIWIWWYIYHAKKIDEESKAFQATLSEQEKK